MHQIKKGAPKGELTLRTSVITHGSKGELALRGTFLFGAHGPYCINHVYKKIFECNRFLLVNNSENNVGQHSAGVGMIR